MGLRTPGRWRSRGWCWCWVLSFALLCSYIGFEVLDLDGSDLLNRLGLGVGLSATVPVEAERVFRVDLTHHAEDTHLVLPAISQPIPQPGASLGAHLRQLVRRSPLLRERVASTAATPSDTISTDPV